MRFMVMVKASKGSEAGEMPSEQLLAAMGAYNEELKERQIFEAEDFGAALTPELREQEDRMRRELEAKNLP